MFVLRGWVQSRDCPEPRQEGGDDGAYGSFGGRGGGGYGGGDRNCYNCESGSVAATAYSAQSHTSTATSLFGSVFQVNQKTGKPIQIKKDHTIPQKLIEDVLEHGVEVRDGKYRNKKYDRVHCRSQPCTSMPIRRKGWI